LKKGGSKTYNSKKQSFLQSKVLVKFFQKLVGFGATPQDTFDLFLQFHPPSRDGGFCSSTEKNPKIKEDKS